MISPLIIFKNLVILCNVIQYEQTIFSTQVYPSFTILPKTVTSYRWTISLSYKSDCFTSVVNPSKRSCSLTYTRHNVSFLEVIVVSLRLGGGKYLSCVPIVENRSLLLQGHFSLKGVQGFLDDFP